jgi:hypothetical protein
VPDLKLDELHDGRGGWVGQSQATPAATAGPGSNGGAVAAWRRRAIAIVGPAALWREHRLFTIAAAASLLPRLLAMLAFRPALLTADSFLYMQGAVNGTLGQIRPSGYSWFLTLLRPVPHPLLAVTIVQHLMGIAVAAIVYGLLRYWGLPAWGATLAAVPVLFDAREIALESYILPDTLYCLVIMVVVALLITKRTPALWQCALAGLLLAYITVLRGNGLPVAVVAAAYLLVRRVGWRAACAAAVAFGVPVLSYALAFNAAYGEFNITSSDGIFLWSRTTTFANCAVIKPPANLVALCPNGSVKAPAKAPAWSIQALLDASTPADYLWAPNAWWRHDAHPGFTAYNNKLGMQFALDAIKAQPLAYLRASAKDVMLQFLNSDRPQTTGAMAFTTAPRFAVIPPYYVYDIREYAGTTSNTHAVEPYAYFLFLYQLPVYFPGVAFFAVLMAGLVGIIRKRRQWGGPAAFPWMLAVLSVVLPALLTQSFYRYTLVAIPLACVAAGLAFIRERPRHSAATAGPALAERALAERASAAPSAARLTAEAPAMAAPAMTEPAMTEPAMTEPTMTAPTIAAFTPGTSITERSAAAPDAAPQAGPLSADVAPDPEQSAAVPPAGPDIGAGPAIGD